MTTEDIDSMPLRKQFALVAHIYKLEIAGMARLVGRTFIEAAMAAATMVCDIAHYTEHRHGHVPKHR